MNVHPIGGLHPTFGSWLERRRARLQAQLAALDEERLEELSSLLAQEEEDRPPHPRSAQERAEYLKLLRDHERVAQRMALLRRRLLDELKDLERERVAGPPPERHRTVGGTFDGYA